MIKKSQNIINYNVVNIRDFADTPHFKVDDSPFGGGDGMIFKPEPIFRAYDSIMKEVGSDKNVKFVFCKTKKYQNLLFIFYSTFKTVPQWPSI